MSRTLFCFGFGYCAKFLSQHMLTMGWQINGTTRNKDKIAQNKSSVTLHELSENVLLSDQALEALKSAEAILISIPPNGHTDLVLENYIDIIRNNKKLQWVGYLSTTGVYGDHNGQWVDEETPPKPNTQRSKNRLAAEENWLAQFKQYDLPVHIFRLGGIYGPYRNAMLRIQKGKGDIILKKGQFFNRIHIDDIVSILYRSINYPSMGEIFNLCDDEPSSQADLMHFAYRMLGYIAPRSIPFEEATMSDMARSFYLSNKRVKNDKVKKMLNIDFKYPTYRKGLTALRYPSGFVQSSEG